MRRVQCLTTRSALLLVLIAAPGMALTPLDIITSSPDTTVALDGAAVADDQVVNDDLHGQVAVLSLPGLPADVGIDGFCFDPGGGVLVSLDAPAEIDGIEFRAADVLGFDGVSYTKVFDSTAAGVPPGADTDAVAADGADLVLSFDVSVDLGVGRYDDEDLVRWDGAAFSLALDGSAVGVAPGLDLDGAHLLSNGHLLLSFDGSGEIGGFAFADEDILELEPAGSTWELALDGSANYAGWDAADIDALSAREPGVVPAAGSIQFSSPSFSRYEPLGPATIFVTRTGGAAGVVSVSFSTSAGTATAGVDYVDVTGTLTWADGDGSPRTFAVPLIDDSFVEGDETVVLTLGYPTGGAVPGSLVTAILTIIDDETTPLPAAIPALGPWGLAFLIALLTAAGSVMLYRRGA